MNDLLEQLPEQIEQLPLIGEYWIYQVFAVVFSALVLAYIVKRVLAQASASYSTADP